eukprot:835055-Rhodomonas_salina.1
MCIRDSSLPPWAGDGLHPHAREREGELLSPYALATRSPASLKHLTKHNGSQPSLAYPPTHSLCHLPTHSLCYPLTPLLSYPPYMQAHARCTLAMQFPTTVRALLFGRARYWCCCTTGNAVCGAEVWYAAVTRWRKIAWAFLRPNKDDANGGGYVRTGQKLRLQLYKYKNFWSVAARSLFFF